MELFDALTLARLQFAFTISFHIVFPAFTIGLASYLAVLEALWLYTGRGVYHVGLQLLEEDLRPQLRHGRRVRHRHELPVRHQLERLLRQDRPGDRPADGLRGADRLLPRGGLPRRHAVRLRARRPRPAFLRHADGGGRHAPLGLLDPVGQQLDADARRLRHQRRRPVHPARLVGRHLQPVVPLPPRAHGAGGLSHHRLRGRRGRRLPSAARQRATRARA